jgi:hypothetical protein
MIYVTDEIVNLYIGVWAETWRGRLDDEQPDIKESRKDAMKRHAEELKVLRIADRVTIFEHDAGYEASSQIQAYSGTRPYLGFRPKDDPDARLFLFLTVEMAVLGLKRHAYCLALHHWVYRRGDRRFMYRPEDGERNEVPRGRSLEQWCKNQRRNVIRPTIKKAIETHVPETIVEATLWELDQKTS